MPWHEQLVPLEMSRVAVVAPTSHWRTVLAAVAESGLLEPDTGASPSGRAPDARGATSAESGESAAAGGPAASTAEGEPPIPEARNVELELERVDGSAVERGDVKALAGWAPTSAVEDLSEKLEPLGGGVVELPRPRGVDPPTLLLSGRTSSFRPLVETYATVPYQDIDPTPFAAAAYVVMFGMMFGDLGDGLLLVLAAFALRFRWFSRLSVFESAWSMVLALGVSAGVFGVLYGEFFGPTGVIPVIWLSPLEEPTTLLAAAIGLGALLLAVSYVIGTVNRWREGGLALALYAPTGIAGATLFLSLALVAGGIYWDEAVVWGAGIALAVVGLTLSFVGLKASAGTGGAAFAQAGVELFDLVIRLLSNVVSFARIAAFGLTHAALGLVVWDATVALWSGLMVILSVLVFVLGRALSFTLEALVAGVQALRLEYYELFSRIFVTEGRPFEPWHVPLATSQEEQC
jgi:V/A-type H+-transporting ATPase subunit I